MEIVRYLDAGRGPLAGIQDGAGVHKLPVPSLSALLALPLAEIRGVTAKATADPAVAGEVTLLPPLEGRMEVWAAGVTYFRSRGSPPGGERRSQFLRPRMTDAERPELFFKSVPMACRHPTASPSLSAVIPALNVPEAELAIVVNSAAEIVGYTVCDDVPSRTHRGGEPAVPAAGEGLRRGLRRGTPHPPGLGDQRDRPGHQHGNHPRRRGGVVGTAPAPARSSARCRASSTACSPSRASPTAPSSPPAPASCPRSPSHSRPVTPSRLKSTRLAS